MYNLEPWCKHCGGLLKPQQTGRPGEYCGTQCRQAARRKRQQQVPPDTTSLDKELLAGAKQLAAETDSLLTMLENNPSSEEPLLSLVRIQQHHDKLLLKAATRAKQRNLSWERIGQILHMHKDSARHKFGHRPSAPVSTPHSTSAPARGTPDDERPAASTATRSSNQLAPVLSHLQRASKLSLRAISERADISPSYLSRILSGERFPNWPVTARIARILGADTSALRKVWEDASAHHGNVRSPTPTELVPALRHLHQRAGSPSAVTLALATAGHLDPADIDAILDGALLPAWNTVHRLVLALDGVPTYFHPLWLRDTSNTTPTPPTRPTAKSTNTRRPDSFEELVAAFSQAFAPQRSAPHSLGPLRRRGPLTPITPLTCWSSARDYPPKPDQLGGPHRTRDIS